MEIWLDSANTDLLKNNWQPLLSGVTTNPQLLADGEKAHQQTPLETIESILKLQPNPICAQVISNHTNQMIKEAVMLNQLSTRMIVKIPVTVNGLSAIKQLHHKNITTLATGVVSPQQALLAYKENPEYLAIYFSHIKATNPKNWRYLVERIVKLKTSTHSTTKLMFASLKTLNDIYLAMEFGADAITLPEDLAYEFFETPTDTLNALDNFSQSWENVTDDLFSLKLQRVC